MHWRWIGIAVFFRAVFSWVSKEISRLLWFCITTLCDWFVKLAPLSQPTRSKTKTNRKLLARVFPRLAPVTSLKCQPSPPPNPQGARERDSLSRAPCGLGGGDGWHFRLRRLHVLVFVLIGSLRCYLCCDWLGKFLWFPFYEDHLKTVLNQYLSFCYVYLKNEFIWFNLADCKLNYVELEFHLVHR